MKHIPGFTLATVLLLPVSLPAQNTPAPVDSISKVLSIISSDTSISGKLSSDAKHVYAVRLNTGQYLRVTLNPAPTDTTVVALRINAPDSTLVGAINNWQREPGPPVFDLLAEKTGPYHLSVTGYGNPEYHLSVRLAGDSLARTKAQSLSEATAWLIHASHKLNSLEAGHAFDDLEPLRRILAGVKVVGLGEATHGSREFEQVKHRFLEFLAREMGYTVFGLEASNDAARSINEYVLTGKGDPARALASQAMWNWDTEEIASTLDWMRDYNSTVSESRKVRFAGFDFQYNPRSRQEIITYLRRVAPERVSRTDSLLEILTQPVDPARPDFVRYYSLKPEAKVHLVAAIHELRRFLDLNRRQFTALGSSAEFEGILHSVHLLEQFADTHSRESYARDTAGTGVSMRDQYMSENVIETLGHFPPGTKMVLSAHNEHIRRDAGLYTMGHYLSEALGDAYYAFGLSFDSGSFKALDLSKRPFKIAALTIGPSFPQSIDWYLKRAGKGNMYVDFRVAPRSGPAASWLGQPHQMRSIGGGHPPSDPGYYREPVIAGKSFDGLIFVERTTPTRLNPTVTR